MIHHHVPLLAALTVLSLPVPAQEQDTSAVPVFRSLEEALREPGRVLRLDLSDQHLGQFPMEVFRFSELVELRLRNDDLNVLPKEIGQLKKLRKLDLSGNPISRLPDQLDRLTELEEFCLNDDPSLLLEPDLRVLARLPRLRVLRLENDGLKDLPDGIRDVRWLEELHLNGNRFEAVPATVRGLEHLRVLDMRANPVDPRIPLDLQQRGVLIRF